MIENEKEFVYFLNEKTGVLHAAVREAFLSYITCVRVARCLCGSYDLVCETGGRYYRFLRGREYGKNIGREIGREVLPHKLTSLNTHLPLYSVHFRTLRLGKSYVCTCGNCFLNSSLAPEATKRLIKLSKIGG